MGDFILVNKFSYGIRLPIVERKIVPVGDPQRGDVVVFRYPVNPSQDFIKRVIGVGGDEVAYRDKRITVNGSPVAAAARRHLQLPRGTAVRDYRALSWKTVAGAPTPREHAIAVTPGAPSVSTGGVRPFPGRENCDYNERGFVCRVPAGHYLMMGDNRDNSDDGRYWGFVPDDHIRGRAFFVWFNWDDITSLAFKRVGSGIR